MSYLWQNFSEKTRVTPEQRSHGDPTVSKKMRTPRCAQYDHKHHRSSAVASPVDAVGSHRMPNAVALCSNKSPVGSNSHAEQYGLLQCNRSSAGVHKGRCANVVVVLGIFTEIVRCSL